MGFTRAAGRVAVPRGPAICRRLFNNDAWWVLVVSGPVPAQHSPASLANW